MEQNIEQKKISPIALIITGVALIGLAFILIDAKKNQVPRDIAETNTPASLCYALNEKTNSQYNDVAFLKLNTTDGGITITGELATYPAEKDAMTGTLSGSAMVADGTVLFDGQYSNSAEGVNNISEQLIKIDPAQAQIGYGEMVEAADGTYDYKDKNAVHYSLTLPAMDCAQYDALKTSLGR